MASAANSARCAVRAGAGSAENADVNDSQSPYCGSYSLRKCYVVAKLRKHQLEATTVGANLKKRKALVFFRLARSTLNVKQSALCDEINVYKLSPR